MDKPTKEELRDMSRDVTGPPEIMPKKKAKPAKKDVPPMTRRRVPMSREEEEMRDMSRDVTPPMGAPGMKKGGKVKKYASGGKVTRGDGICKKGHTKGKMV